MNRRTGSVRLVVAVGLLVSAACLVAIARAEGETAALARTLSILPGGGSDDTRYADTSQAAWLFAATAAALGGSIVITGRRALYALGAICSLLFLGVGLWVGLTSEPLVWSTELGPISMSRPAVATILIASSTVVFGSSLLALAWLRGLPAPARPHMPPATHQG